MQQGAEHAAELPGGSIACRQQLPNLLNIVACVAKAPGHLYKRPSPESTCSMTTEVSGSLHIGCDARAALSDCSWPCSCWPVVALSQPFCIKWKHSLLSVTPYFMNTFELWLQMSLSLSSDTCLKDLERHTTNGIAQALLLAPGSAVSSKALPQHRPNHHQPLAH